MKNPNTPDTNDKSPPLSLDGFLPPPTIPKHLDHQPFLERAAEVLKYTVLCMEFTISPTGKLRRWIKFILTLFAWCIIPIILLVPGIVYLCNALAGISEDLRIFVSNTANSAISISIVAFILVLIVVLIKR